MNQKNRFILVWAANIFNLLLFLYHSFRVLTIYSNGEQIEFRGLFILYVVCVTINLVALGFGIYNTVRMIKQNKENFSVYEKDYLGRTWGSFDKE